MRRLLLAILLLTPLSISAQESRSGPLFMKDMLGDREFFAPWGIGVDIFIMQQDYSITNLEFDLQNPDLPSFPSIDPSLVEVSNDVQNYDLRADVWITPFLNVFGLVGRVDADTYVDLSAVSIPGLGIPLGSLGVSYDGTVYGLGFTLAYGSDRWFASLTNTWTDSSLSGDFNSSVSGFTAQPRIGLNFKSGWTTWVGGMYLDTDEKHRGEIELPILGPVDFNVELESSEQWNYTAGVGRIFSPRASMYLELGFGDRKHTLFNFTFRF
jgi:hypothetical protein